MSKVERLILLVDKPRLKQAFYLLEFVPQKPSGKITSIDDLGLPLDRLFVEIKYDGVHGLLCKDKGKYVMYSSHGKPLGGNFKSLIKALKPWLDKGWCFDGEITAMTDSGKLNWSKAVSAAKNSRFPEDKIVFVVFDVLNKDELKKGFGDQYFFDTPLKERRALLLKIIRKLRSPNIRVSKRYKIRKKEDFKRLIAEVYYKGGEGLVFKDKLAPYQVMAKGSAAHALMWKNKIAYRKTFPIIAIKEGTGKRASTTGSIQVLQPNGDIYSVGTGFSDKIADKIWEIRDKLIGKEAEILWYGQPPSPNRLLRAPVVFLGIFDKGKPLVKNEKYDFYVENSKPYQISESFSKLIKLLDKIDEGTIKVKVYDINSGQVLGIIDASDFMKYFKKKGLVSQKAFLNDIVDKFNKEKEKMGEPERVEIVLK